MYKKNIFFTLFVAVAISGLFFFMQNCSQSSSSTPVVETATPVVIVSTSTATINLAEGATADFAVTLNVAPSSAVTMTATADNLALATVIPASLTFTPGNWNVPQTITLTGVEDANADNEDTTVTVVSPGLPTLTLTVHITDNDTLAIHTSVSSVTLNEGATNTFGVNLSAQPPSSLTVGLASPDTNAVLVSPATMTFTPTNWSTPQTATVTGVEDVDVTDESVSLAVTSTGLSSLSVSSQVIDNDIITIVTSVSSVAVTEGGMSSFGVKLGAQPAANTTVLLAAADTTAATVSPSSFSFTPTNWNSYQFAVVNGIADADTVNETTTIQLTSTGVVTSNVTVNVTDTTPVLSPQGSACASDNACSSGFCTDGYCCEARCAGTCERCNATARFGHCDASALNTDPDNDCATSAASTCQRTGTCSGSRSCSLYSAGTVCVAGSCSGNTAIAPDTCNGSGTCVDGGTTACGGLTCNPANGQCQ